MMKWIKIILILAILGAAGYGAYLYFFTEEEVPVLFGIRFPKESLDLVQSVEIREYEDTWSVTASTRNDLFFAQGLCHGKVAGKDLTLLRNLFKGQTSSQLPLDLRELAEFFFYLDLEHVARTSEAMYTAGIHGILDSYARGLSEAIGVDWAVEDVLLMQRGYAFLLGHNFVKEWSSNHLVNALGESAFQSISDYPLSGLGGIAPQVKLLKSPESLFGAPLLELVRSSTSAMTALQTRSHPWLSFVFQINTLSLSDQFQAKGLSLAGTPFLWSGVTADLMFTTLPIAVDDEQFSQVAATSFVGRDKALFRNESASQSADYQNAPLHSRYGRSINPIVSGNAGMEYFYDWDGFRASADLTALYSLLEVKNFDQAITAWQYSQVPAVELTLRNKTGRKINIQAHPSKPEDAESRRSLARRIFKRPFFHMGAPLTPVRGMYFSVEKPIGGLDPNKKGHSQLDRELASMATFYINGPMAGGVVPEKQRQAMSNILTGKPSQERDYLLMLIWHELLETISNHYLSETGDELVTPSVYPQLKRFLLLSLGRNEGTGNVWNQGPLNTRVRLMEDVFAKVWRTWNKAASASPPFPYLYAPSAEEESETFTGSGPRSKDATPGTFWTTRGNIINRVASYTLIWGTDFNVRIYEHVSSGKIGPSQNVRPDPGKGRVFLVKPKI